MKNLDLLKYINNINFNNNQIYNRCKKISLIKNNEVKLLIII